MNTVVISVPRWHRFARCDGLGDAMFPAKGDRAGEIAAKRECRRCVVAADCLRDALEVGDFEGVRGGFNGPERRRLAAGAQPRNCERCQGWFVVQWPGQIRCRGCSARVAGRQP